MELRGHRRAKKPQSGFFRRHYYRIFSGRMQGKSRFRDFRGFPPPSSQRAAQAWGFAASHRWLEQSPSGTSAAKRLNRQSARAPCQCFPSGGSGMPAARRECAERMESERVSFKIRISPSPVGRWRRCLPRRAAPCWAGRRRSSGSREWRLRRAPAPWTCRSPGRR